MSLKISSGFRVNVYMHGHYKHHILNFPVCILLNLNKCLDYVKFLYGLVVIL